MARLVPAMFALVLAGAIGTAQAQTGGRTPPRPQPRPARPRSTAPPIPGPERVRVMVNGGFQLAPGSFGQAFSLMKNVESMPITTDLSLGVGGFVDVGARVRVTRSLSVGVVGFIGGARATGTLDAQVPHPLYFNQPRAISGELPRLGHFERGVHVELAYPVSIKKGREVTVFGGPSYISLRQALVTDVSYSETYPYDSATFTAATSKEFSKGALGFNAGADVTWRLNRSLRAGALVRYSYASMSLTAGTGNVVDLHAGGLQVAAGLRILIQKRPPRPARPARPAPPARPRR